jgi:hypothetical protein
MRITATKDMDGLRAAARQRITRAAAAERAKHVTGGKANIYAAKKAEAAAWLAKSGAKKKEADALAGLPFLAAEVAATGRTADDVATVWRDKAQQYDTVTAPGIEGREMRAKAAIDAAGSPAELDAITL